MKKINILAAILVCIGLLGYIGYFAKLNRLKGIGLAYLIAPLPLVFSQVNGYEPFSSRFKLTILDENNSPIQIDVDNKLSANLSGPYNRRNVYGASISYAPVLNPEIVKRVLYYAVCSMPIFPSLPKGKSVTLTVYDKKGSSWSWSTQCLPS